MNNPEAVDRLNAFREVMAENNLPVEEGRIFYGEFRPYDGKAAIEQYMESGLALPDAFICANDAMALTAVSTLEKYGFCVPLDVIVTCTWRLNAYSPRAAAAQTAVSAA